jgi:histidine triad (HIT) family protein
VTTTSTGCWFCERLRNPGSHAAGWIYEDDLVHVSHWSSEGELAYRGALVIQTRRHTEHGLASLTDLEGRRIGLLVAQLSRALKEVTGAGWTYTYCFTEGFRHVHQFVVARYLETPPEHVRTELQSWPGAPRVSLEEVRRLSGVLAGRIASPTAKGPK